MKNINIRHARTKDAGAILGLIRDLAVQHQAEAMIIYTKEDLVRAGVGSKDAPVGALVAEDEDGKIVGLLLYFYRFSTWKGPTVHIEDLVVSPECRGMGIGGAMVDMMAELAKSKKIDRVELDVEADNENAIRFYQKKGYEVKDWYAAKLYLNGKIKD